jgi:hypothetical protein
VGVILAGISIRDRLLADRRALLDLGTRNRLVHIPLRAKNIRAIEIVDEKSAEVFRILGEGKRFTFLPAAKEETDSHSTVNGENSPGKAAQLALKDESTDGSRDELNRHAEMMHAVHEPSGLTPFQMLGNLIRTDA